MRTVSATLNQAANDDTRKPVMRVTLRDTLLRFNQTPFASPTNPWGATGSEQVSGEDIVPGNAIALSNGKVVRVWVSTEGGQAATLWVNTVTTPSTAAQWSTWVNTAIASDPNCNPGLVEWTGNVWMFYMVSGVLWYRTSTIASAGAVWSAAVSTGINLGGGGAVTIAVAQMVTNDHRIFACLVLNGAIRVFAITFNGSWSVHERPWFQDGNLSHAISFHAYDSTSFFDAFTVGGRTYHVYSWAATGECWIGEYNNGVWGNPTKLLPNDYSHFHPYQATVIEGRCWITGRMQRNNEAAWSPSWDMYLYSDDGINWTAASRDSFITDAEVRGKFLLAGPTVQTRVLYYAGIDRVLSAPATWLVDPQADKSALQLVLGNANMGLWGDTAAFAGQTVYPDLHRVEAAFPAAGTAPTLNVDVANGDESWYHSPKLDLLKPDAELTLDLGYQTGAAGAEEYVTVLQASLDTYSEANNLGMRQLQFTGRDTLFKRLRDYNSLFYWPLTSQARNYDNCDVMDRMVPLSGTWEAKARNRLKNAGFENPLTSTDWQRIGATGSALNSILRATDPAIVPQEGSWSLRFIKGDNAVTTLGVQQTGLAITADHSYTFTLKVQPIALVGGLQQLQLNIVFTGVSGTVTYSDTHNNPLSDPDSGNDWQDYTVSFLAPEAGTAVVNFLMSNVLTGTVYIDTGTFSDNDHQISFEQVDTDGLIYTTSPAYVTDFDIRARFYLDASVTSNSISMGLAGCIVDKSNYIVFQLQKVAGTYTLGLWKKRGGIFTALINSVLFTWAANQYVDLRMVHRGGHFWLYARLAPVINGGITNRTWTGPLFVSAGYDHFVWNPATHGPVCPSDDGTGRLGVRAYRKPLMFTGARADQYARVIPILRGDRDWATFPSSGRLIWGENEQCDYTRKSTGTAPIYLRGPENWGWFARRMRTNPDGFVVHYQDWAPAAWWWMLDCTPCVGNPEIAGYDATPVAITAAHNVGVTAWDHGAQNVPITAGSVGGWALQFVHPSGALGAAWETLLARDMSGGFAESSTADHAPSGGNLRLGGAPGWPGAHDPQGAPDAAWTTWAGSAAALASGYENVLTADNYHSYLQFRGGPGNLIPNNGDVLLRLAPALGNVTRGAHGTAPSTHEDEEAVRLFSDDVIRIYEFRSCDLNTDWNTEQILQRACALSGVLDTEFDSYYAYEGPDVGGIVTPSFLALIDVAGAGDVLRLNFDLSGNFVPATTSYEFRVFFHWAGDSRNREIHFESDGTNTWVSYEYIGSVPTIFPILNGFEKFKVPQRPLEAGRTNSFRIVVSGEWTTVYLNGALVANFHVSTLQTDLGTSQTTDNTQQVYLEGDGATAFSNLRIPQLDEWRDALRIDTNQSIGDFLGLVVEDRPIFWVSRSGLAIKFSTFTERDMLTPQDDVNDIQSFRYRIMDDQIQLTDNERFSFARVEAVGILEFLDPVQAAANGFVLRQFHMNKADNPLAEVMTNRAVVLMQESLAIVANTLAANLRFETEDGFNTTYTDPATGTVNEGRVDPAAGSTVRRSLIVNDVGFVCDEQGMWMQVGARQRMS